MLEVNKEFKSPAIIWFLVFVIGVGEGLGDGDGLGEGVGFGTGTGTTPAPWAVASLNPVNVKSLVLLVFCKAIPL